MRFRLLARTAALAAAVAASAGSVVASSPASAAPYASRGYCIGTSGPTCYFWTAKVTEVADGDTIKVVLSGETTERSVRFTGINAMEMSVYSHDPSRWRGECHALDATRYVYSMISQAHWSVRLVAQDPASMSGSRLRRSVQAYVGGRWVDLGQYEVGAGLALWMPSGTEWAWTHEYGVLAQQAAARRVGLYNTASCGSGPSQTAALRMWVQWDADGDDGTNVNGEFARIRNDSAYDVPIGGWWFRDSSYLGPGPYARGYVFPSWAVIRAHGEVTVRVGSGTTTSTTFYWGQPSPVFANTTGAPRYDGDGGYLFDPQGDLRAWMIYPCFVACTDPAAGALRLTAHPTAPAFVDVTNLHDAALPLEGYLLERYPYAYPFPAGTVLPGHGMLRLYFGGSPTSDSATVKHWAGAPVLYQGGGDLTLSNFRDSTFACTSWGAGQCDPSLVVAPPRVSAARMVLRR